MQIRNESREQELSWRGEPSLDQPTATEQTPEQTRNGVSGPVTEGC